MTRAFVRRHALAIAVCLWSVAALAVCGCGTALDVAEQGRGGLSKALGEVAVKWLDYDHQHQLELVNKSHTTAEANQALGQYRDTVQEPVVKGLHDVQSAMALLDDAIKMWKAGKQGDLAGLLSAAWGAAHELAHLLDVHGVPIPTTGLLGGL